MPMHIVDYYNYYTVGEPTDENRLLLQLIGDQGGLSLLAAHLFSRRRIRFVPDKTDPGNVMSVWS